MTDREVPLFEELDDQQLERVRAIASEKAYAKGEILLKQGEKADTVFLILDGAVRVTAIMAEEDELVGRDEEVLVKLKAGECVGELSFVTGAVPSLSVIAEEGARVMALPHDKLRELLDSDGPLCRKILFAMMRALAGRLRDTDRELVLSRYFIRGR